MCAHKDAIDKCVLRPFTGASTESDNVSESDAQASTSGNDLFFTYFKKFGFTKCMF